MAFLSLFTNRLGGIIPKPATLVTQFAKCGTSAKDFIGEHQEAENCNEDHPVSDMDNPFQKDRRLCILCKMNITPDYKNPKLLSQFVSMYTGKIYGRHITGLCKTRQEQVEKEILKSQNAGMMPYYLKDPAFMQDPQLFNPDTPFRNHSY
uniref:28S ribosomal protein S18c, mitochondrial n=2 Tax=Graphocephala atropunctata TaxID=36148 RepID=A0A1B6M2D4_9HEMI